MDGFKSGKQRRAEIRAERARRREKRAQQICFPPSSSVPVDYAKLAFNNSYDISVFALRGYYVDQPFVCRDCGVAGVWTAQQQRWWYETLRGSQHAIASRCRPCRLRERQRKEQARQASLAGLLSKQARQVADGCLGVRVSTRAAKPAI